jgi:hypothetical protein
VEAWNVLPVGMDVDVQQGKDVYGFASAVARQIFIKTG